MADRIKCIKRVLAFTIFSFVKNLVVQYEDDSDDVEDEFAFICTGLHKEYTSNRINGYMDNIVSSYDEIEFQRHFKLQRSTFEKLLQVIAPLLCNNQSRTGRPQVDPQKQLLAVLWILATPDSYRSIGLKFGIAKSTLSVCFMRVIKALCNIAPTIIKWPQGADVGKSKESFKKLSNIPNVIGVIDGSYIPIKAPKEDPEVYINRKCFHAITVES